MLCFIVIVVVVVIVSETKEEDPAPWGPNAQFLYPLQMAKMAAPSNMAAPLCSLLRLVENIGTNHTSLLKRAASTLISALVPSFSPEQPSQVDRLAL